MKNIIQNINKVTVLYSLLLVLTIICFCDFIIIINSENKTFSSINELPYNKVGLVLGASKYLKNGNINPYFKNRVIAAAQLYKTNKISYILISGENSKTTYNEPEDFKKELIKLGIPKNKIVLDYAGFRTLDSIVRAKKVFNLKNFTIISQTFHNERALYIAKKYGLQTVAFNAKGVQNKYTFFQNYREYLARVKVFIDLIFNIQPKFLGKQITIN